MIDKIEWVQIMTALRLMSSPLSVGDRETVFKNNVIDLLEAFKDGQKEERI